MCLNVQSDLENDTLLKYVLDSYKSEISELIPENTAHPATFFVKYRYASILHLCTLIQLYFGTSIYHNSRSRVFFS